MPMEKGFWKQIDPDALTGKEEKTAWLELKSAVEDDKPQEARDKARIKLIAELTKRPKIRQLMPDGKELTVNYTGRMLNIGFVNKKEARFLEI
jgi:hypothetical protein